MPEFGYFVIRLLLSILLRRSDIQSTLSSTAQLPSDFQVLLIQVSVCSAVAQPFMQPLHLTYSTNVNVYCLCIH